MCVNDNMVSLAEPVYALGYEWYADIKSILNFLQEKPHVYLYGAGLYGRFCEEMLAREGVGFEGFIVSDGYRTEDIIRNASHPVFLLNEIQDDAAIVICSAHAQEEMKNACESANITYCVMRVEEVREEIEERLLTQINNRLRKIGRGSLQKNGMEVYGIIPFIDIEVGTACTLSCKYCNENMKEFKRQRKCRMLDAEGILRDLELLLAQIDRLVVASLLGGETFLHNELYRIVDYLEHSDKVDSIEIVTNGTIFPNIENRRALQTSKKVNVHISNYPLTDDVNRQKLLAWMRENAVKHEIVLDEFGWEDMGEMYRRNLALDELRRSFEHCYGYWCACLADGRLWRCGTSWILHELLGYQPDDSEYIELSQISSKEDMLKVLHDFYGRHFLESCQYCQPAGHRRRVRPGEQ